jgi:hypothetical protein
MAPGSGLSAQASTETPSGTSAGTSMETPSGASAGNAAGSDLALSRVSLFSSGVGYFEHTGTVTGVDICALPPLGIKQVFSGGALVYSAK